MNGGAKAIIWIVIFVAVLFGIYMVLPEYPQNFIKGFVQPIVNTQAKTRIEQVKNLTNKDVENATYKDILENNTNTTCWTYAVDETTGAEHVYFYGKGASINLKDYVDYNGTFSTGAVIKVDFVITNNNVDILPYVDDLETPKNIKDGKHVEENNKIKKEIFYQLYTGMKVEQQ